jgi:hypothetical protein
MIYDSARDFAKISKVCAAAIMPNVAVTGEAVP